MVSYFQLAAGLNPLFLYFMPIYLPLFPSAIHFTLKTEAARSSETLYPTATLDSITIQETSTGMKTSHLILHMVAFINVSGKCMNFDRSVYLLERAFSRHLHIRAFQCHQIQDMAPVQEVSEATT
jgi:hypothetical protein